MGNALLLTILICGSAGTTVLAVMEWRKIKAAELRRREAFIEKWFR